MTVDRYCIRNVVPKTIIITISCIPDLPPYPPGCRVSNGKHRENTKYKDVREIVTTDRSKMWPLIKADDL